MKYVRHAADRPGQRVTLTVARGAFSQPIRGGAPSPAHGSELLNVFIIKQERLNYAWEVFDIKATAAQGLFAFNVRPVT